MDEVPLYMHVGPPLGHRGERPLYATAPVRHGASCLPSSALTAQIPTRPVSGKECRLGAGSSPSGDTTPCRMTGVTLHSHVRYKEIYARTCSGHGSSSPVLPALLFRLSTPVHQSQLHFRTPYTGAPLSYENAFP